MLSYIYWKKRLLLAIVLFIILLQAAVVVLKRRKEYFSGVVLSSNNLSKWYSSQNAPEGGIISNLLRDFIQVQDDRMVSNRIELTESNKENYGSSDVNNRVKVKMKRYKEIQKSNLNIFFIESRCGTSRTSRTFGLNSTFNLKPRQCCSVESAATMNPRRNVYILHTCPLATDTDLHLPTYARHMLSLQNVFVVPVSMAEALRGTPVSGLYRSGKLENSLYPIVHASDILRLVVLWSFGGTYCDMDILSIRSLDDLGSNFCGMESLKCIGNSILNFEPAGRGHDILTKLLVQVNAGFNGNVWAANGPELVTNTMLRECKTTVANLTQCSVFTVFNNTVLYPLLWKNHMDMFNASTGAAVAKSIKDTGVTIHLWNKFTAEYSVQVGSSQAYGLLADEFCPAVYRNSGLLF